MDSRATAAETARYKKINPTKAMELKSSATKGELEFLVSNGWLEKFISRYLLSLRKKTTQSQRVAADLVP